MQQTESRYEWLISLGQFAAWVVTSIGALVDALYIREGILAILQTLQLLDQQLYHQRGGVGLNLQFSYGLTLFDDVMILILGCAALVFVILIEAYYRKGRALGLLWKRVAKVAIIEVAIFALLGLILLYI